jgi:DNA-binding transcriptional MerR regulator
MEALAQDTGLPDSTMVGHPDPSDVDHDRPAVSGRWVTGAAASKHFGRATRTLRTWAKQGKIHRKYDAEGQALYFVEGPADPGVEAAAEAGDGRTQSVADVADAGRPIPADDGHDRELITQLESERDYLRRKNDELVEQISGFRQDIVDFRQQLELRDEDLRDTRSKLDSLSGFVMTQLPEQLAELGRSGNDGGREVTIRGPKLSWWRRVFG